MKMRTCSAGILLLSGLLLAAAPLLRAEAQDVDVQGNLTMHDSADPTVGNILKEGVPFLHNFGANNTFLGSGAGNFTMSGYNNTASGFIALSGNTTGNNNTATGAGALLSNIGGNWNTASGAQALYSNYNGVQNTATGFWALYSNYEGIDNTASGSQALFSNTTGGANTASGAFALYRNNGSENTASGFHALYSNTTGDGNTACGSIALQYNTTGNYNTALGFAALRYNTTGSDNTAIGWGAGTPFGMGDLINATAIGNGAMVNASNKIRFGNTAVTVIEGQVPYTYTSDRNEKENFRAVDAEAVLAKIRGLNVTSWNYKGQDAKQFRHYGPVAQDFFAAFGHDAVGTIGTPTTITSGDLDGILLIAAQALEKRTVEQQKEIAALKAELEEIKRKVGGEIAAKKGTGF
jgi:trimeric autotransporter adhesin